MSRHVLLYGVGVSTVLAVALVSNLLLLQAPRQSVPGLAQSGDARTSAARPPLQAATAATPSEVNPLILNAGARSEVVRAVQRELDALGYVPGPIDGRETQVTRAAVMAYEYDNGLPLTAEASSILLQALLFGVPPVANGVAAPGAGLPATREAREIVSMVGTALLRKGYLSGGPETGGAIASESVIRGYERAHGLPVTGRISGPLIAHLLGPSGAGKLALGTVATAD